MISAKNFPFGWQIHELYSNACGKIINRYLSANFMDGVQHDYCIVAKMLQPTVECALDCVSWDEREPVLKRVHEYADNGECFQSMKIRANSDFMAYYKSLGMINSLISLNNGDPVLSNGLRSERDNTIANTLAGIELYYPGKIPGDMYSWYRRLTSNDNSERIHAISELANIVFLLSESEQGCGQRLPKAWVHHMCDSVGNWFISDEVLGDVQNDSE